MGKKIRAILALVILISVTVGVFFFLIYMEDSLRPPVTIEESFESLGIERLILDIEDIDNQIKALEIQQQGISGHITQLKINRSEAVAKINKLLDQIREISNTGFPDLTIQ